MADDNSIGEEGKKEGIGDIELKRVRVSDFKLYFSNDVQISPGESDVQFFFGQIMAPIAGEAPKEVISTQLFGVAVSIENAKRVLGLLDQQVKLWEKLKAARLKPLEGEKE